MELLLSVLVIHFFALLSPGPDFFFVLYTSATQKRSAVMFGVFGIVMGIMFWAAVALLGLNFIFQQMPWVRQIIYLLGASYLLYMAYQLITAKAQPVLTASNTTGKQTKFLFLKGFFTNLSNPKALIYFASIFATLIGSGMSNEQKMSVFILVSLESLLWFSLVAILFSQTWAKKIYFRFSKIINTITGILFGVFSIKILSDIF